MNSREVVNPLLTSRIVWAALSFSMLFYGFILFELKKATFVKIPEDYTLLEIIALASGLIIFLTLWIHEKKIKPINDMNKRFPLYVICWALNEIIVVMAFAAVIVSENSNGFVYVTNVMLAFLGNFLLFPREAPSGVKNFDGIDRSYTDP